MKYLKAKLVLKLSIITSLLSSIIAFASIDNNDSIEPSVLNALSASLFSDSN